MDQAHALSNLITLTTPGGIERQERQGQAQFVASQQLPRKFNGHPDGRQVLEGFGFRYGINADELFVNVQFPEGWVKQGGNHAMWSTVVDEQGRTRLSIFYKAAFYDTDAFINISRRFRISQYDHCDENGTVLPDEVDSKFYGVSVRDWDGTVLFRAGHCGSKEWSEHERLRVVAKEWLGGRYPDWEKCSAYWDLPAFTGIES